MLFSLVVVCLIVVWIEGVVVVVVLLIILMLISICGNVCIVDVRLDNDELVCIMWVINCSLVMMLLLVEFSVGMMMWLDCLFLRL